MRKLLLPWQTINIDVSTSNAFNSLYLCFSVPCLQPDVHKETPWAVNALAIAGNIAIARHACISAGLVTMFFFHRVIDFATG